MDNNNFRTSEDKLMYSNEIYLQLPAFIKMFLILNKYELIIVLLDSNELKSNRNVFCYTFDKQLKWKIPEPDKIHAKNHYTSLYLSNEDILKAYNINGVEVVIDKISGEILSKELIK